MLVWVVMRISGNGAMWGGIHQLALAAGPLSLFIPLTPIQELDVTRTDNPAGMTVVGLAALRFLLWLWRRVKGRQARLTKANSSDPSSKAKNI